MGPELWYEYLDYGRMRDAAARSGSFEFAQIADMPSATVLPLCMFIRRSGISWTTPWNADLGALMSAMIGRTPDTVFGRRPQSSLIRLQGDRKSQAEVTNLMSDQQRGGEDFGGRNVFKYLVEELADNVYQHARSENAYILARRSMDGTQSELSFIDDGRTIGGTLSEAGIPVENDRLAVTRAASGLSSKGGEERGYGLYSTLRILTEGLHGTVLIVSGKGALERTWTPRRVVVQKAYHVRGEIHGLDGTLVSARVPSPAPKLNLYDFTN